ncbi:MAG: hypothetical protein AAFR27_08185 [Pseudomonadota bacterium]
MSQPQQETAVASAPVAAAAPTQATDLRDETEIAELRQSVSDIREVLDHLISNRNRRYG